jgi:hypothetical protein
MIDLIRRGQTNVYGQVSVTAKGLTATNIINNGNFANGTSGWYGTNATISVSNNIMQVVPDGSASIGWLIQNTSYPISPSKKYFIKAKLRVTNNDCVRMSVMIRSTGGSGDSIYRITAPVANQWYSLAIILDSLDTHTGNFRLLFSHDYADVNIANGKVMEVQEVMAIDLTAHGLENKTYEELNQMFPHWFDSTKSTLSARVKSVGKNILPTNASEWEIGSLSGADGSYSALPNYLRTKSFIKILSGSNINKSIGSGYSIVGTFFYDANNYISFSVNATITVPANTSYYKQVIRRSDSSSLQVGDIEQAKPQIEYGAVATTYEPYRESIAYIPEVGRSLPNGVKDEVREGQNGWEKVQRVSNKKIIQEQHVVSVSDSSGITYASIANVLQSDMLDYGTNDTHATKIHVYGYSPRKDSSISECLGKYWIATTYVRIGLPLGTSLEQAQTALTGVTLTYQLAEPVVTQLDPQPLTIFPNGTQYIEFGTKEVAEYADGINISNADIPIKAMKTVDKLHIEDGHWKRTAIDLANVAVSPDGLSFTIADAVNGETYEYSYDYDSALSTMPDLEVGEPSLVTRNNRTIVL